MFSHFEKVFDINRTSEINLHISWMDVQVEQVNKIIEYAATKPDAQSHISFLEGYRDIIKEHISKFQKAIENTKGLLIKLDTYLGNLDVKSSFGNEDMFQIEGIQFCVSYYNGTFSFLAHIDYDQYFKKNIHAVFDYEYNGERLKAIRQKIMFSESAINELRNHPIYIIEEINKMDEEKTVEDVNVRYMHCKQLLLNMFRVKDLIGLIRHEDAYFEYFFGKPSELYRKMSRKRTDNVIKLQLEDKIDGEVTDKIISLIETEDFLKTYCQKYDKDNIYFGEPEYYEKKKKDTIDKKNALLNDIGINQETLDEYLSYINLQVEED